MEPQRVWKIFDSLPTQAKREVIDFMEFLQKRHKKPQGFKKSKITEETFVGMWTNHDPVKDSGKWIRELRRHEWNN